MAIDQASLDRVRSHIDRVCTQVGRPLGSVRLMAVSKGHPAEAVRQAYALGLRDFGENYIQELNHKADELAELKDLRWHVIGPMQRNKVKLALGLATSIQTVNSIALLERIESVAQGLERCVPILIQVNVAEEAQKSGCSVQELPELIHHAAQLKHVHLQGLMLVPPNEPPEVVRVYFRRLYELGQQYGLAELSMGMSADYAIAIEEGATIVRVGSVLFGSRP